ncbi:hypothetical protein APHAL10511_003466 [Amanita phalloides]|nr:hypothetical protein APHAL10511_003466 [Amanita phalloides]
MQMGVRRWRGQLGSSTSLENVKASHHFSADWSPLFPPQRYHICMEAIFDNKTNVLDTHIRATHDNSVIYTVTTTFGFWGRKQVTILKDANPPPGESPVVGAINWKERYFEVHAHRKVLSEIKKKEQISLQSVMNGFEKWDMTRARFWKWSPQAREYQVSFNKNEWQVLTADSEDEKELVGAFSVAFRPRIIHKEKPLSLKLSRKALKNDEVFLILLLIYSEAKRQEESNFGPVTGAGAW